MRGDLAIFIFLFQTVAVTDVRKKQTVLTVSDHFLTHFSIFYDIQDLSTSMLHVIKD